MKPKPSHILFALLAAGALCGCPKDGECVGNGCKEATPTATETTFNPAH